MKLEDLTHHSHVGLYEQPKYIDIDFDECVIPLYLKDRLAKKLKEGNIPPMIFSGWHPAIKTILANALAKRLNAQILCLVFNKEPKKKGYAKGDITLKELDNVLRHYETKGEKKMILFESFGKFPEERYPDLAALLLREKYHNFIVYYHDRNLNSVMNLPVISCDFSINHSEKEEKVYWDQCANFLKRFNRILSIEEMKAIVKNHHEYWVALSGRELNKLILKHVNFITVIPTKMKDGEHKGQYRREVQI